MMNRARRSLLLIVAVFVPVAALAGWLVVRRMAPPPPGLDQICALARAGKFDQAESLLERYLRAFPDDALGHRYMAEFATDRPDPQPELALQHLRLIRPETQAQAALVQYFMGKAHLQQARYDLAETCWNEALRLDPRVPEAGATLFSLLELEGRMEEAHKLGLRLFHIESDKRDLVRWLINVARLDIEVPAPSSVVDLLEPQVRQRPHNLHMAVALGLALVHDSRGDEGVAVLRDVVRRHPLDPAAWNALLKGLDDAGQLETLAQEYARLPESLRDDLRFAMYAGRLAQALQDWKGAARAYLRAYELQPYNGVLLYRLSRVLRPAGEAAEAERVGQLLATYQEAYKQLREVIDEAIKIRTLGVSRQTALYQRLADLREKMGRTDDARAWHLLVLIDDPQEPTSRAALERLK
jgi:tetratricopeptide (TPR) repeat protein